MTDEVYEWYQLEETARQNTLTRRLGLGRKALIAVKAQHPLNPDGTPGPEYEQRLEKALQVRDELEANGLIMADFMTFGGVHEGHEMMTLAEAGRSWLIENGVEAEAIKTCPVVYSGNDEDRLAAEEFLGNPEYSQIHVVMSAGQWERARLYYISVACSRNFMRLRSWTAVRIIARFASCGEAGRCRRLRKGRRRFVG